MLAAGQTAPSYSGEAFTAQIVTETINSLNQVKPSDLRGIPVVNQNFQESSRFRTGSVISSDDGDQRRSRVTTTESTQSHQVLGNPFAEDEPAEKYTPYYAQNPYQ